MPAEEDFLDINEAEPTPEGATPGGFGLNGQDQMPTMEQILDMIEQASGLSDEEKASIKEDVINFQKEKDAGLLGAGARGGNLVTAAAAAGGLFAPGNIVFAVLVTLLILIFGLFVYKLIKAEKDKELARERKRKAKEEKKNKKKRT